MKRRPKPLLLTLIILPIVAFAAFYFSRSQQMLSEAEILANFKTHKATFRKLAQMARTDGILYVSGSYGRHLASQFSDPDSGDELPAKRVQQYAALMRKCGVESVIRSPTTRVVRFRIASGQRGIQKGWTFGIAWEHLHSGQASRAVPLVVSAYRTLPKAPVFIDDPNFTFSKIEPNWFLYRSEF